MGNLFIRAHAARHGDVEDALGTGWEDTLTEAMAFYLRSDPVALDNWICLLLGPDAPPVVEIETQYASGGDRPDLAFHLQSGHLLLVENKAGAGLQPRQLERYLALRGRDQEPASVALMDLRERDISEEVRANPRYLRPEGRTHFLWQDFYRCIPSPEAGFGLSWTRTAMRSYLGTLGLAPSSLVGQWPRLFGDRLVPEDRAVQQAFGMKWSGVRAQLDAMRLKVTGESHSGLQAALARGTPLLHLALRPARPQREYLAPVSVQTVDNEVLKIALGNRPRSPTYPRRRACVIVASYRGGTDEQHVRPFHLPGPLG